MSEDFKIITLIASATEIVCALGLEKHLVGRSHECDFPKWVMELPSCSSTKFLTDGSSYEIHQRLMAIVQEGLSVYKVDAKVLNSLRPSILITQDQCEVCAVSYKDLEQAVCEVILSKPQVISLNTNCIADLWKDILEVAKECGVEESGTLLINQLRTRMERVSYLSAIAASHEGRPKVASIEWIDPLMTAGNWMPELVEMAGGANCFGVAGKHSPWISWDQVRKANPDVLFISPCGFDLDRTEKEAQIMKRFAGWTDLAAVKDDRVFIADGNAYFHRPGPRLVESLEILTNILHPSLSSKIPLPVGESFRKLTLN